MEESRLIEINSSPLGEEFETDIAMTVIGRLLARRIDARMATARGQRASSASRNLGSSIGITSVFALVARAAQLNHAQLAACIAQEGLTSMTPLEIRFRCRRRPHCTPT